MSSPIPGDSPSLHERPARKQSEHMSPKKHDTGIPMNTPTDPNSVIPGDGGSTDHAVPTRGPRYHHQSPGGERCNGTGWGPEFFPNCEDPGTPTEMNSPTRYEAFAAAHRSEPLQGSGHDTSPTLKSQGRRNVRKSAQPSENPRRSKRIQKKQSKGVKGDGNTSRTASGLPVTPGIQRGLQLFQKELRLLEEQNKKRLEGRLEERSEKRI